ncbi:T9SS C-terminal target domain-containing protein [Segetibacter koreensis]|uniref:T9SS C-terminal target domain-containing protein n=1 Tax=Segetibacter koreensis TaxID=398037 RepID=UPI00037F76DF|nr:T9SS C-terminal target domain-containing protein [Segetibacter koreensis]
MKRPVSIVTITALLFSSISSYCQYANLEFVENKGQWDESVKFKGVMNNGAFFLKEKGFRVLQSNPEDLQKMAFYHGVSYESTKKMEARSIIPSNDKDRITVHSHVYDVQFINAQTPVIVADKPLSTYNNYIIGNDPSKWKGNCRIYQAITYQNIYPGIDIRYYTNEQKLKYDIVVHAGADLSRLAMKYDGVDGLQVKNEQLVIKTSVGETRELAPYAYQVVAGVKKEVGCRFKVAGKTVQFAINGYSKSSDLIIDPTLIFSTFSGSNADNWGYTATYGPDGSFYAGGIVFAAGFPTNPGAFNTTYNSGTNDDEGIGGYDIGIIKFTPNGDNRTYATYLGGSGNEQPHSLVVDGQGELVIAGRTNSANYPTTVTDRPGGKYDIILTKLNAAGSALVGSRKIGGSEWDGVNIRPKYPLSATIQSIRRNYGDDARSEVIIDNSGDILVASNTQSPDFPVSAGAFQKTFAGKQDGVIIKLTPDLSNILFSTFLGGSGNDAAFVLAINPTDNNIYVGGNTDSTNLPGDKTNVLHPTYQGGGTDGFVSIISPDGRTLLKTTYIGTQGVDMLYGIQFDKFSFPYIMGTTTSDSWPVVNAAFSQSKGKQFIAKLKPDLSAYEYSTVFGSGSKEPNISPIAFLVDRCENVYVSGWGGSVDTRGGYASAGTSGLSVTPDAIQSRTDNSDFYFFVLERNATAQLYGSFFGQSGGFGEHVDGGTSRFDRNGVIYQALCANCGRDVSFPTTPGVWSPSNGSAECNLAAVKIAFNLAGVAGSVRASINGVVRDTSGCVPLTVDFADTLALGKMYIWDFGDGSAEVKTMDPTTSHTYNKVGNYQVRLISIDSSKCNIADSAYTHIRVRTDKVSLGFTPKKLLPCESANYQFLNTSFVTPSGRPFTNTSFTWYFGDNTPPVAAGTNPVTHAFPGVGVYNVKLVLTDTSFCNAPDSIEIALRIASNLKAQFETPASGCAPYNAVFNNLSEGGQQFYWDFGDGGTSTEVSPTHLYSVPGTYKIKLEAVDSGTCNKIDTTGTAIIVSDKPTAAYTFTPNPPQENTPVAFANSSIAATRYVWDFGDGETLATTSQATVSHIYNLTGTFNSCLIAINNFGCEDTTCQNIVARVIPLLDVPNAFTPNGDGINDKVFVRGFGISKMTWRIYNRWGQMVFETNDRTAGWDGTYKGSMQPKEVYHYILSVQYSDNTKYEKKGDITLLR